MTTQRRTATSPMPRDIISASIEERIEYFRNYKVKHPKLKDAFDAAMQAFTRSAGPQVVLLTGPTGVGKSTMCEAIYKRLKELHKSGMEKDRSFVPVMKGNAISPTATHFSWKDFYLRLLKHYGEPLLDYKINMPRQGEMFPDPSVFQRWERSVVDALRRSVEECLRRRRTKVLLIDEAHHMLMVKDSKMLQYQFEALKSLTIETGVIIGLFGTYQLLDIRDQSGQLVRRSEIVPLLRYDLRIRADQSSFASALEELQEHLPLKDQPDLMENLPYYYAKCGGCIGILKEWLLRCLEYALAHRACFDQKLAERMSLTNKALKTIINEAFLCEEKLSDIGLEEIERMLKRGLPPTSAPSAPVGRKSKVRVGERNPKRDPVGGAYVARA